MKLQDAILLGEFALPPAHGNWIAYEDNKPCAGCAIGRTCIAAGYQPLRNTATTYRDQPLAMSLFMEQRWPWVKTVPCTIPATRIKMHSYWATPGPDMNPVFCAISNLYEGGWSMKEIAAFIATLEPAPVAIPPLAVERVEVEA